MSDYLTAVCRFCGHAVKMTVEHGGRRAKCPKCEGIIEIPKGETSLRLRSDRELTSEARAKAGKGPDTDLEDTPSQAGRTGAARVRRTALPPKRPASRRNTALIITLIATALVIGGIVAILVSR
jgi:hypothetical protein